MLALRVRECARCVREEREVADAGWCVASGCSTASPPALPEWCSDPACALPTDMSGGWCVTRDDEGQVLIPSCDSCSSVSVLGQSWGACSSNPRLPGAPFDYVPADMERIASLSMSALLEEVRLILLS